MNIAVIILAAGKGKRMCSDVPKVLHTIGGKPLLEHAVCTVTEVISQLKNNQVIEKSNICIVIDAEERGALIRSALQDKYALSWAVQQKQLGTANAVECAYPHISEKADMVLVMMGDVPMIRVETLYELVHTASDGSLGLITAKLDQPQGYGRIIRNQAGRIMSIVEDKDLLDGQRAIKEINSGVMVIPGKKIEGWLKKITQNNAQNEYYLTDIFEIANTEGVEICNVMAEEKEIYGVNTCVQKASTERYYQQLIAHKLMQEGVTLLDPTRLDIRGEITVGRNVIIDINCIFHGRVVIEDDVSIGPGCYIGNTTIKKGATIKPYSMIEGAFIGPQSAVGPFARVRPETEINQGARIGNFVEIKKSSVGKDSKIGHLSYIGDTALGEEVNIGAGTITCNYDGVKKYKTEIQKGAFIGSNTALVAPICIGKEATIGAGSTVTKDVKNRQLVVERSEQKHIDHWVRPQERIQKK